MFVRPGNVVHLDDIRSSWLLCSSSRCSFALATLFVFTMFFCSGNVVRLDDVRSSCRRSFLLLVLFVLTTFVRPSDVRTPVDVVPLAEQIDGWAKQPPQVPCISENLKC